MGQKIDQAKIETIRQEFLSGSTLRSLSGKHGVSLRSLADYSKNGEWEMQRKSQQLATGVEVLASAADKRVAAVVQRHHEDTKGVFDKLQMIADQASAFLADRKAELEKADFKDLASLLKIVVESQSKLHDLMAKRGGDGQPLQVFISIPAYPDIENDKAV